MKDEFRLALLLTSLGFVFAATSANCQKTLSNNEDVPTVPSTTQATTCTKNNGNPCPE